MGLLLAFPGFFFLGALAHALFKLSNLFRRELSLFYDMGGNENQKVDLCVIRGIPFKKIPEYRDLTKVSQ